MLILYCLELIKLLFLLPSPICLPDSCTLGLHCGLVYVFLVET